MNVSKTGLFLAAGTPLDVGRVIVMLFEIAWEGIEVPVGVIGIIVREKNMTAQHAGEYQYGYGVKFNSARMQL